MPSIAYHNLFTSGTVSVDSDDTDYPKENAYDWFIYPGDVWKPATSGTHYITLDAGAAVDADYWGVYGHDIDSVKLQYSTDNFSTSINDVGTAVTPTGDEPIYKEFTSVNARYWRLEVIKSAGPSSLGLVMLGEKLTIPESVPVGFRPYTLAGGDEYLNSESDGGYPLGRSIIRKGAELNVDFELLTPAFIRNSWDPFVQHAENYPFMFAWDYSNYPAEIGLCWTEGKQPKASYHLPNLMRASLRAKVRA